MNSRKTKQLGQNFLVNARAARRIVQAFRPGRDDLVLEIGPGRGALTGHLAESGARICAVEKDRALIGSLKERFQDTPDVTIICADVLEHDFRRFCPPEKEGDRKIRVIGNLPYGISKPVLMKTVSERRGIQDFIFMLQREVAWKILSGPGSKEYSPLSVLFSLTSALKKVMELSPNSFSPPPRVYSTVVSGTFLERAGFEEEEEDDVKKIISLLFSQRRKTIRNNLSLLFRGSEEAIEPLLDRCHLRPEMRVEMLEPRDFVNIARFIRMKGKGILL